MNIAQFLESADAALHAEVMKNAPMTAVIVGQDHIILKILGDTLLPYLKYPWPHEVIGQPVEIFLPEHMREAHKTWFDDWMKHPC